MHWRHRRMRRPAANEPGHVHELTFSCFRGFSFLRADRTCQWLADAINAAHGTSLTKDFFAELGRETLKLEREFNRRAGFTERDDELPAFFYTEPVAPTNHVARFHATDVHSMYDRLLT